MGIKEEIYDFCVKQNRSLTARDVVEALYPGKTQPYVNSYITTLVYEHKLVRDDTVKPYIIRVPFEGENVIAKKYSKDIRQSTIKKKGMREDICRPCKEEAEKYLLGWNKLDNYVMQEKALDKLFFNTYPNNKDIEDILVKVSTLNDFYSTNIFSAYAVAKHIWELNIDERLEVGDESLVNDIASINFNGKTKNFYSFATKYCSHHRPYDYAIYDSYVDKVLKYFRNIDRFAEFEDEELKNYSKFHKVLKEFQKFYNLEIYDLKLLDRYLWQLGKDKFQKKYK